MKFTILAAVAVSFAALLAAPAHATPQQEKMKTCNAEAKTKELKGDERKAFMKSCLSNKPAAAEPTAKTKQQEKMKTCNADAKGKSGDERKKFMKECLAA